MDLVQRGETHLSSTLVGLATAGFVWVMALSFLHGEKDDHEADRHEHTLLPRRRRALRGSIGARQVLACSRAEEV